MIPELPRKDHRHVVRRVIVRSVLVLETPTCLGSGDADSPTDLPLLRDSVSKCALLTGASIAGALRNYLREYELGFGKREEEKFISLAITLFGGDRGNIEGDQSPLIVNDSISSNVPVVELRDGVRIDSKTGTAAEKAKYDLELLAAGTEFPLYFELLIEQQQDSNQLFKALALVLQGFEQGEISIGMKKRRGFGRCKVENWQVWNFDLQDPTQRYKWLTYDHWTPELTEGYELQDSIAKALGVSLENDGCKRDRLCISATFNLVGSLLIRSGQATTGCAPDVVHLTSHRDGADKPIISGTSLAGVLRHRAERIIKTLNKNMTIIDELFGSDMKDRPKNPTASRLIVHESVIKNSTNLVQNRIAIDRFTGGALHGALFDEQPVFGGEVTFELELRNPKCYEIGLLLLLIKDLWTGDLAIGGESSIGRGRLQGKSVTITHHKPGVERKEWTIRQKEEKLEISAVNSSANDLEAFVTELGREVSAV